jgi:hypothetical protein
MIDVLEHFVDTPRPSGLEDAAAIQGEVEDLGDVTRVSNNLMLRLPASHRSPSLMLVAPRDQIGLLMKWGLRGIERTIDVLVAFVAIDATSVADVARRPAFPFGENP